MARNMLSSKNTFALMTRMKEDYVSSGLNDNEYAQKLLAEECFDFSLTTANIAGARNALGLPANYKVKQEAKNGPAIDDRITLVLDELHTLQTCMRELKDEVKQLRTRLGAQ